MTRESSRISFKVILVLKQHSKVRFWPSKLIFELSSSIFWTSMSIFDSPTAQNWTSMSISGGPTAYQMDLNAHFWRSHCILNGPQHLWQSHCILLDLNATKTLGSWKYCKQPILRTSHPDSHSIKPVNWAAIQSNQSTGQLSWQPLNQISQPDSHPGSN